ncbi:hypothetical protein SD961_04130 [Erwinia sp. MMLR14_017]|uniref:hypothetical protein n=1 Tax=Erwinia sp. MMLR14_017 TaxID=3093842 RepID=UPI00298F6D11|nr:hypothetical protein [Erwinia sp. MMLR14_017]MDW8845085.1 hypothetical protein [Erwinia sp. MMLR14_017]
MAIPDSTTTSCTEIICPTPECKPTFDTLLKMPIGTTMDLFQILDCCQSLVDALIETDDNNNRMALCGRLYAALKVSEVVLKAPLPASLIERLTADVAEAEDYCCPLSADSETLREYCAALTLLLLQHQQPPEQEEQIAGVLYELIGVLNEDLKAPRFVRTTDGLLKPSEIH